MEDFICSSRLKVFIVTLVSYFNILVACDNPPALLESPLAIGDTLGISTLGAPSLHRTFSAYGTYTFPKSLSKKPQESGSAAPKSPSFPKKGDACVSTRWFQDHEKKLLRLDIGLPGEEGFASMFFFSENGVVQVMPHKDSLTKEIKVVCQTHNRTYDDELGGYSSKHLGFAGMFKRVRSRKRLAEAKRIVESEQIETTNEAGVAGSDEEENENEKGEKSSVASETTASDSTLEIAEASSDDVLTGRDRQASLNSKDNDILLMYIGATGDVFGSLNVILYEKLLQDGSKVYTGLDTILPASVGGFSRFWYYHHDFSVDDEIFEWKKYCNRSLDEAGELVKLAKGPSGDKYCKK